MKKTCGCCKLIKDVSCFSPMEKGILGVHTYCKTCRNIKNTAQAKEWRKNNRERSNQASREWSKRNRDYRLEYWKEYSKKNRLKIRHKSHLRRGAFLSNCSYCLGKK